jgi:acylphosphatase
MDKQAHIVVHGKVQGVWYRASTQKVARSLGLRGWVRNLPTGEVEILAQGDEQAVKELIQWCYQGPPAAEVTKVDVEWEEPGRPFGDFEVRRDIF